MRASRGADRASCLAVNPHNREASAARRVTLLAAFHALPEDAQADLLEAVESISRPGGPVDRWALREIIDAIYAVADVLDPGRGWVQAPAEPVGECGHTALDAVVGCDDPIHPREPDILPPRIEVVSTGTATGTWPGGEPGTVRDAYAAIKVATKR